MADLEGKLRELEHCPNHHAAMVDCLWCNTLRSRIPEAAALGRAEGLEMAEKLACRKGLEFLAEAIKRIGMLRCILLTNGSMNNREKEELAEFLESSRTFRDNNYANRGDAGK